MFMKLTDVILCIDISLYVILTLLDWLHVYFQRLNEAYSRKCPWNASCSFQNNRQ